MDLPEIVSGKERLYRVVKRSTPEYIQQDGRVSPALFKDVRGVSVDRKGGRAEKDAILFIKTVTFLKRAKAVTALSAGFCHKIGADVVAAPSDINPYHAIIMLDNKDEKQRNLQALKLADHCTIVYFDEGIEWL